MINAIPTSSTLTMSRVSVGALPLTHPVSTVQRYAAAIYAASPPNTRLTISTSCALGA